MTYELVYPRFIHSELMTHRLFSRNAASSRAIPVSKFVAQVLENPAMPIYWGENRSGMSAASEVDASSISDAIEIWSKAASTMAAAASALADLGIHKQISNRLLEPFQLMKTVVSATEWNNWFTLRNHADAQPEIKLLAEMMLEARDLAEPVELDFMEWHLPYINEHERSLYNTEALKKISVARCARTSYKGFNGEDLKPEDDFALCEKLFSTPFHGSPFEHVATPFWFLDVVDPVEEMNLDKSITHIDENIIPWSGNFRGWQQYRQTFADNYVKG